MSHLKMSEINLLEAFFSWYNESAEESKLLVWSETTLAGGETVRSRDLYLARRVPRGVCAFNNNAIPPIQATTAAGKVANGLVEKTVT